MATRRNNLDSVFNEENDRLEKFGKDTEEMFARLGEDIRKQFNQNLNKILNEDLKNFQQSVTNSLAAAGLETLGPALGNFIGGGENSLFGSAFGAASIAAAKGLDRNGKFDLRNIANAFAGGAMHSILGNTAVGANGLNFSRGQQSALFFSQLNKGTRNF